MSAAMTLLLLLAARLTAGPTLPPPAAGVTPVEIVVFSDFQCPFCARFAQPLRALQKSGASGVPVHVTFRHFPLPFHPKARLAHQAAAAAGAQGRFWEMHDLLFADQERADRADLIGYARLLHLDLPRFERDMDSAPVQQAIDADFFDGSRRGIGGTPTFFVNGREHSGHTPLDELTAIVVAEERRARVLSEIPDATMSLGRADAPIVVELFADFLSRPSRPALEALKELMRQRPAAVRIQFRNFPLSFHPQAALAHEAAVTAAKSGRFWDFAAALLDRPAAPGEADLVALAAGLGLDGAAFAAALREHRYAARVDADVQAGAQRGLRGSPVILVDDRRIDGVPSIQTLIEAVDAAAVARSRPGQPRKQ
jgi:protein-disulfide isomerase